jgi:HTH-type transcriptional regulator/antitoxin HigA
MSEKTQTVGQAIKAEMEKRGWTQSDLAMVLGKHQPYINELAQDKRSITPEMAMALAAAFGNAPEFWLNLDSTYRLSLLEPNSEIGRRSKILGLAPVKDMEKRGWIRPTSSLDALETELCRFYNIESIDDRPKFHANARKSFETQNLNPAQAAWCIRAAKLATVIDAESFDGNNFKDAIPEIVKLADYPEKSKHLAKLLAKAGVRLVVIEPLPYSKIDGAAFWLADDAPVVVLSLRYDRIDCLWFTLLHELSHIRHRDAQSVDSEIFGEQNGEILDEVEKRANREAASALISKAALESFILRVKPFYSKPKIVQFAIRMNVHPGIVVGQLQHRKEIQWGANREMLAKVREIATSTALTDGWGKSAPTL